MTEQLKQVRSIQLQIKITNRDLSDLETIRCELQKELERAIKGLSRDEFKQMIEQDRRTSG